MTVVAAGLALAAPRSSDGPAISQLQESDSYQAVGDVLIDTSEISHQAGAFRATRSALLDGPAFSTAVAQALAAHRSALLGIDNGIAFNKAVHQTINNTLPISKA